MVVLYTDGDSSLCEVKIFFRAICRVWMCLFDAEKISCLIINEEKSEIPQNFDTSSYHKPECLSPLYPFFKL